MGANEILCYINFQKLALLGKSTTPSSDFWVLAGALGLKRHPPSLCQEYIAWVRFFSPGLTMEGISSMHQRLLFSSNLPLVNMKFGWW